MWTGYSCTPYQPFLLVRIRLFKVLAVLPLTDASCPLIVLEVSCDTSPIVLGDVPSAIVLDDIWSDSNASCPKTLPQIRLIVVNIGVEDSLTVLPSTNASFPLTVTDISCDTLSVLL